MEYVYTVRITYTSGEESIDVVCTDRLLALQHAAHIARHKQRTTGSYKTALSIRIVNMKE